MENKPIGSATPTPQPSNHPKRRFPWALRIAIIVVGVAAVLGYLFIPSLLNSNGKNTSNTGKVLTIDDLDKSDTELDGKTSDASVENLTKELKAKIEKQIANKENPIDTVMTLVGVLCSTANATRQNQCIEYITNFLDTKMDTLKLSSEEYGQPDALRIAYWQAKFYANLAYGYKFIMDNEFTGSGGKPVDTTAEQLKYVNLYLGTAQNSANWGEPQTSEEDGHTWYYYEYGDTDDFIEWREQLEAKGTQ